MFRRRGIRAHVASCVALALALGAMGATTAGTAAAKTAKPKAFRSCGDWVRYARAQSLGIVRPTGLPSTPGDRGRAPSAAPSVPLSGDGGGGGGGGGDERNAVAAPVAGQDFSTTNVQEQGVDEPDRVKTDGRVAYVAEIDGRIRALDVSGAGTPRELGTLDFDGGYPELLLHGNKLIVISEPGDEAADGVGTIIREVDVTNPSAMRVDRIMQVEGWYVGARATGSTARIVIHTEPAIDYEDWPEGEPWDEDVALDRAEKAIKRAKISTWRPAYKLVNRRTRKKSWRALVPCDAVRRPAEFAGVGTLTVLTIDLERGLPPVDSDALFADADTVYGSPDSLYTATERWDEADDPDADGATTIYKFAAPATPETTYKATGTIDGYLLSQWSLSEHEGVLRAATTTEAPWEEDQETPNSENFVYTLKEGEGGALAQVGQVGGLGKGEAIYAVRFIGPIGYVVTFEQIDPLYTIDLSDPVKPRVAGELKIPGYSAYLHPVGEGLLLGVGQDADSRGRIRGTALQLFDVSDPARPSLLHKHTLEGDNYSEVEWDHRGFLYWPATKTTVIPVEAYAEDENDDFVGAIGYRVDAERGIEEIGRIQHGSGYDAGWLDRTFVVGSTLYSVSDAGVGANAVDTFGPIGFLRFGQRGDE